jgi:hypothetical protein
MGYLNNSVITVDAILTTKGRQLLAQNDGSFRITQFALADDEIDYTLLLEAFPEANQIMKYKLATLPRGTAKLPVLDIGFSAITLQQGAQLAITPQTLNYLGNDQTFETSGYSCTVADVRLLNTFDATGINTSAATAANASSTQTIGTNVSSTVIGTQINLRATTVNTLYGSGQTSIVSTLTVTGLDSGARVTVPLTVTRTTT